jgi:ATP-dependent Clp protease ATP-binding subunit ClpA
MAEKFDKFTDRARRVLTLAQEEAQRFNHNYIGTEHLLLGLVREGEGVAAKVWVTWVCNCPVFARLWNLSLVVATPW